MRKSNINFIKSFIIPIIFLIPFGLLNYFFLKNIGEITPLNQVISIQNETNALYGTALHSNVYPYKMALYRKTKPKIVLIGSSTVLQFREMFFNNSFINLGRTTNYPLEGEKLVKDILKIHKPHIVLFGIDFWWGNNSKDYTEGLNFNHHIDYGQKLSPDGIIAPFKWILDGKININDYFQVILNENYLNQSKYIGINAKFNGVGFAKDGSSYHLGQIYGRNVFKNEKKFSKTLKRINLNSKQFIYGNEVSIARLNSIKKIVNDLESSGVRVITFLNPLPPLVYDKINLNKKNYLYINLFRNSLNRLHHFHYDFYNPDSINTNNCEFLDGFHGGDIVSARILNNLTKKKENGIVEWIDEKYLKFIIKKYKDMVLTNHFYKNFSEREVDFLHLGCKKI